MEKKLSWLTKNKQFFYKISFFILIPKLLSWTNMEWTEFDLGRIMAIGMNGAMVVVYKKIEI